MEAWKNRGLYISSYASHIIAYKFHVLKSVVDDMNVYIPSLNL
jgi:hypothetical protein